MKFLRLLLATVMLCLPVAAVFASQGSGCVKTTGTFNGLQENTDINAANAAFISMNSGATAPATDCSGVPVKGQGWLNTTINSVNLYDGLNWLYLGVMDTVNHIWKPVVGGGVETLNSAATTDVCSVPGSVVNISGTATITSFGATCTPGSFKMLVFTGTPTLTYSAALTFQGHLPITAAAGDTAFAFYLGSGNWQLNYNQASGQAMVNPTVELATVQMTSAASLPANGKYVFGAGQAISRASFPDYLAAVTRSQNGVRTTGNPTLTGVADTSAMGVGMPVEGTGIQAGTTIVSVTSNSITMSQNAASSGTNMATVFFTGYGASGSTSTVGVPDCRGRAIAGRDDMNGTPANRLTASYFGASPAAINAVGGNESTAMQIANLIQHDHTMFLHDPGHSHSVAISANPNGAGSCCNPTPGVGPIATSTNTTGITLWSDGDGIGTQNHVGKTGSASPTPMRTTQPTLIANCIVRVLAMNFPVPLPVNDNDIRYAIYDRRVG